MPTVQVYALSTCPWCRKAKQFFSDNGVPFECTDVDLLSPEAQEEVSDRVYKLTGTLQYPVAIIGDAVVTGYRPEKYVALLGLRLG